MVNLLGNGDTIQLTAAPFQTQDGEPHATGEPAAALRENGTTVRLQDRQPFDRTGFWTAGFPLPGMDRLEIVMSQRPDNPSGTAGAAVVGSTPLLGSFHELPLHQQGHPGAPGAPDVHGDGVLVERFGGGRDGRVRGGTARSPRPSTSSRMPTRTRSTNRAHRRRTACGSPGCAPRRRAWRPSWPTHALNTVLGNPYPFDGTWDDVANFLSG